MAQLLAQQRVSRLEDPTVRALPANVARTSDIPYAGNENPRQTLDLLVPAERTNAPLPVIVFIHGGAWQSGDKSAGLQDAIPFVASGHYAAALVGYRLSDEGKWPNQIHDCKAAIRWIRANAARYALDGNRIGVMGASAGGHLVAMLGTSGEVPSMDGTLGPHGDVSSRVSCVVDLFGPTDFLRMNDTATPEATLDHDAPQSPESRLIGGPIQEKPDIVATANPISYASADDPPILIVHGTRDPLVPFNQSELLHQAMKKAGVSSTLVTIEGAGHGSGFGPDVAKLVERFFEHHLRGEVTIWEDLTLKADIPEPQ
jgi:acetyl esterase/lipase